MKNLLNSFICLTLLLLLSTSLSAQSYCKDTEDFVLSLNPWAQELELNGASFLIGNYNYTDINITPSVVGCDNLGLIEYELTANLLGDPISCSGTFTIVDNTPPVMISKESVTVILNENDEFEITPEIIDNGSFDNCNGLTLEVSPSMVTSDDAGNLVLVELCGTDDFGNQNCVRTQVRVLAHNNFELACLDQVQINVAPNQTLQLFPEDFVFSGGSTDFDLRIEDGNGNVISTSGLLPQGIEGNFTFVVTDNVTQNTCWGTLLINTDETACPLLVCNAELFVVAVEDQNGDPTSLINADMLLEGNYSNCDLDTMEIQLISNNGTEFEGTGFVVVDQTGTFNFLIEDPVSDNSCWGTLTIEPSGPCETVELNFPDEVIEISAVGVTIDNFEHNLSPQELILNYGFTADQVDVTWTINDNCYAIASSYDDLVIWGMDENSTNAFKIIRTWTILDWISGDIWEFVQIIRNVVEPQYICDFLPNSAETGTCGSGHSETDDVEWPDDLAISDYRITPSALQTYSGIDFEDTRPIFFNTPELYKASYEDIIESQTIIEVVINRKWTVLRDEVEIATYIQELILDLSETAETIAINTFTGRPVPNVELVDGVYTLINGTAVCEGCENIDPSLDDTPINGVNIKDLMLIQHHILGFATLNEYQLMSADVNNDSSVSAIDLVEIRRLIRNGTVNYDADWFFVNEESLPTFVQPKGEYTAIKPGDVDDSAIISTVEDLEQVEMSILDFVINNGQTYTTELNYDAEELALGMEIHLAFDPTAINITDVTIEGDDLELDFNISPEGKLDIALTNSNSVGFVYDQDNPLTITFEATADEILHRVMDFSEERKSYLVEIDYDLKELILDLENLIGTNTEDITEHRNILNVYPNPASDYFNVDFLDNQNEDFFIELYDAVGRKVTSVVNNNRVNIENALNGMYYYRIIRNNKSYTGKLTISK